VLSCNYRSSEHFVKILSEFAKDNHKTVYEFPSTLNSHERYLVHEVCLMQSYFYLNFIIMICGHLFVCLNVVLLHRFSPIPQMDIIRAMMIVWRVRGKIIRSGLCILCATTVHSAVHTHTHTYEQT